MAISVSIHPSSWGGAEVTTGSDRHYKGATSFKADMASLNGETDVTITFTLDGDTDARHFGNSNDLRLEFVSITGLTITAEDGVKLVHGRTRAMEAHPSVSGVYQSTSTSVTSATYPAIDLDDNDVLPVMLGTTDPGVDDTPWTSAAAVARGMMYRTGNRLYVRPPAGKAMDATLMTTWAEVGFRFDDCEDVTLSNLDVRGGSYACSSQDIGAGTHARIRGLTIQNCKFQACQIPFIEAHTTGTPGDWTITGNIVRWCYQGILPIVGNNNVQNGALTFTGNRLEYIGHHEITNDRHSLNVEQTTSADVSNNVFSYVTSGITLDYYAAGLTFNATIANNTFTNVEWLGSTWRYDSSGDSNADENAITLEGAQAEIDAANIFVQIHDNTIDKCAAAAIRFNAIAESASVQKTQMYDNLITNCPVAFESINSTWATQWNNGVQGAYIAKNRIAHCTQPFVFLQNGNAGTEDSDANKQILSNWEITGNTIRLDKGIRNIALRGAVAAMGAPPYTEYAQIVPYELVAFNGAVQGDPNDAGYGLAASSPPSPKRRKRKRRKVLYGNVVLSEDAVRNIKR